MRAAVLGSPVGHSLSPVLHRTAYAALGLDWTYESHDVDAAGLAAFLDRLDGSWAGLSLTMPLKRAVLPLLDALSPRASTVGAVNTVLLGAGRRVGHNTDVPGLVAALGERGITAAAAPAVLGAGATAASAVAALAELGATEVLVLARRPAATGELRDLAARLGVGLEVLPWAAAGQALGRPLVVATVPGDAAAGVVPAVPSRPGVLFDAVYEPWPTRLAAAWAAAGGTVLGGLDLLVHQAVLQVALMTGRDVVPDLLVPALRAAGERELAARRGASG